MYKNRLCLVAFLVLIPGALAQVLSPPEIKDPDLRALQQKYMDDLKLVGEDILAIQFEYPFYLSRKLDLDLQQQKSADQRSIRFDRFKDQPVLAITGNYFAAYSAEKINSDERARTTLLKVVLPILKAAVPRLQTNRDVRGYAIEVSHHIVGKVMGVSMERPENLFVYLPQAAALKLLSAKDDAAQQAALLQGQVFLNAQPTTIWLKGQGPQLATASPDEQTRTSSEAAQVGAEVGSGTDGQTQPPVATNFPKPSRTVASAPAPRDSSPQALAALQTSEQETIAGLVKDLDPQAHFASNVPQNFVAFRQGIYLEFSLNTNLPEAPGTSRYKLAALAFDEHIAKLIRPVAGYFKDEQKFDGVGFSTVIHLAGRAAGGSAEAVEFFFPFSAMHCYESYDCTGQQLIDAGTVLINGERVGLDLQVAESGPGH